MLVFAELSPRGARTHPRQGTVGLLPECRGTRHRSQRARRAPLHARISAMNKNMLKQHALHLVMAHYRPENKRSHHLLQRLGFEQEGRALSYLDIDGCWKDHLLTSLINEASR
jgi:L-amino acid N-acyltransferase YncA